MRISGFTIARQAVAFGYPLAESLRSLLPLVDELVVNVGDCDDGTWETVQALRDPKIVAFRSTWDMTKGGLLTLSEETNKALARCDGEWAIYLQADEVLHEAERADVLAALKRYRTGRVEALSLRYYHFYGSYRTYKDDPRYQYRRATRIVRTGIGIESAGDACAFMCRSNGELRKPRRRDLNVHVFHYGWVRPPAQMHLKQRNLDRMFFGEAGGEGVAHLTELDSTMVFGDARNLRTFRGAHPEVMRERIAAANWPVPRPETGPVPAWIRRAYVHGVWFIRGVWGALKHRSRF